MKLKKIVSLLISMAMITSLSACTSKTAKAKFPTKSINIVVGFNPGGASDLTSRMIGKSMSAKLGVPVVVTNKAGATGSLALEYVKNAKPDGYTINYMPVECTMVKSLGYTTITPSDFEFIGKVMSITAALTVRKDAKWNTIEEFLAYAKANPGKVKVGNSGSGSIWQIASLSLADKSGVQFNDVPFDGAAPAVTALLGAHIDAVTVSPSEVITNVKSGDLKVLGIMSEKEDPLFPGVPTFKSKGIDVSVEGWGGFAVPKGTPADIKSVLEAAVKEATTSEEFKTFCAQKAMTIDYKNGADTQKYANDQFTYYSELMKKFGLAK